MAIDLFGNEVPNDAELEADSLAKLNRAMPPRKREALTQAQRNTLHTQIDNDEAKDKLDRDLLVEVLLLEEDAKVLAEPNLDPRDYPKYFEEEGVLQTHSLIIKQRERKQEAIDRVASAEAIDLQTQRADLREGEGE